MVSNVYSSSFLPHYFWVLHELGTQSLESIKWGSAFSVCASVLPIWDTSNLEAIVDFSSAHDAKPRREASMLEDRNPDCHKAPNKLKRWPKLEHSFFCHQLLFLAHQHHDNPKWNNFESQGQNCPQSHYLNHQIILYVHMQIHFLNKIVGNDLTSICTQILALILRKLTAEPEWVESVWKTTEEPWVIWVQCKLRICCCGCCQVVECDPSSRTVSGWGTGDVLLDLAAHISSVWCNAVVF